MDRPTSLQLTCLLKPTLDSVDTHRSVECKILSHISTNINERLLSMAIRPKLTWLMPQLASCSDSHPHSHNSSSVLHLQFPSMPSNSISTHHQSILMMETTSIWKCIPSIWRTRDLQEVSWLLPWVSCSM